MITNERQYRISKSQLEKFERAFASAAEPGPSAEVHPRIHQAMQDGLESQIADLREQLDRYEGLRSGRIASRVITSILELLPALIEARIAAGLTQRALADRLGVAEQQVQRWEQATYAGVSVDRVQQIADAVELTFGAETVGYSVAPH